MSCYIHSDVQHARDLHQETLENYAQIHRIFDLLEQFAITLQEAHHHNDLRCAGEISNYHPDFLGKNPGRIMNSVFTPDDARKTIALEYGFGSWDQVSYAKINHEFEEAVNFLVTGKQAALRELVSENPNLLTMRSDFGHAAALIHYAGNNGVELWRQLVPSNLPQMVTMLIETGANKDITADFYGEAYTTRDLAATSAHPKAAGIESELLKALD